MGFDSLILVVSDSCGRGETPGFLITLSSLSRVLKVILQEDVCGLLLASLFLGVYWECSGASPPPSIYLGATFFW